MSDRHFIYGTATDFLTGKTVADTDDERIRQRIARLLVEDKGYGREEIDARRCLTVRVDADTGTVPVDFIVRHAGTARMLVLYGPGSLVTRQRGALAAARLIEPRVVPFAAVTNGDDALVMETKTGKVIAEGLAGIPSREALLEREAGVLPETLSEARREKESRILFAMEVLTRRECETYTCRLC